MPSQFQDYFNDKINQEIERNALVGVSTKYDEVQKAATDKIAQLDIAHKEALKIRELQNNSWVGKLGLDPDGLAGEVVNKTASFVSGASTQLGNLVSLPTSLSAAADESSLTQSEIEAYNRKTQGIATPEDLTLLTRKKAFYAERDTPEAKARAQALADQNPDGMTALDLIERTVKARDISNKITGATDISGIVHSKQRDRLTKEMGWDFQKSWDQAGLANLFEKDKEIGGAKDVAEGLAKLVYSAGEAAVSNPSAATEYVVENLPQLLAGGLLKNGTKILTAANAGYAIDNYNKGMAKYAAENNGAMPPAEDRQKMALYAASTAVAEQLGELGQLRAIGKVAKSVEDGAKTGFIQGTKNTIKAGATGYAEEAATEGYQTFAEGQAKREAVTAKDVYIGAGIGGLAGGGTSLGGRAGAELLGATPEKQQQRVDTLKRSEAFSEAVKTGNVDSLLDIKSMNYDPEAAVTALQSHSALEGTAEEVKQANLEKATKIVSDLEAKRAEVANNHSRFTDGYLQQLQSDRDEAIAAGQDEAVKLYDEQIADIMKDTKSEPRLRKQLDKVDQQLADSKSALNAFHEELQNKSVDLDSAIEQIKSSGDKATSQQAAEQVINLSMATPERLRSDVATGLAEDMTNGLTDQQRAYFRAFTDARVAENAAKDSDAVNSDILYGNKEGKYVGIQQYRQDINAAMAANDQGTAVQKLAALSKFAADHAAKAQAGAKALKRSAELRKPVQIRSDGQQGWFIQEDNLLSDEQRRAEGAFTVHAGSSKQINGFMLEARAINAAVKELSAAVDVKVLPPSEANNVEDTSPAKGTDTAAKQPTTQATAEASSTAGVGADRQGTTEPAVPSSDVAVPAAAADTGTRDGVTEEAPASSVSTKEEGQLQSTETAAETSTAEEPVQGLTVLSTKTSEQELPPGTKMGAVFRTINRAVAFLKQTKARIDNDADIAKDRPLVSLPNMLSMWNEGKVVPSDFFADGLSEEEAGALNTFHKFAEQWAPLVRANLIKGGLENMKGKMPSPEFAFEDPIQDFFNPDGSIDENVVTAIVYGAYAWMTNSLNGTLLKDDETVLKMFGQQEGNGVTVASGRNPLRTLATTQDQAANAMGRFVVDALGLKANGKQTADYMGRLTTAFGLQAMVLLAQEEVNLIDTVTLEGNEVNEYLPGLDVQPVGKTKGRVTRSGEKAEARDVYPQFSFVRIRTSKGYKLDGASKEIKDTSVQSYGVVQRLFSAERPVEFASLKPIKFGQHMAKKTKQLISKFQRKVLTEATEVPQRVIPAMWDALNILGDEVFLRAAGWKEYHEDKVQAENRENVLARNMGLESQVANMRALVSDAIKNSDDKINQAFYTTREVWRNFRVGEAANNLNLQTSKIQRFSFFRPDWVSKIDLNDQAAEDSFLIAVAQAFGVKIDQQANEKTLDMFVDKVNAEEGRISGLAYALAKALETPDQDTLTSGQKQEIGDFAASEEGMQTLQALVAYGKYLVAKEAGAPEVEVHMLVGVDGKTNGPILTQLALGAADSVQGLFERLNRGGMYKGDDGVKNFNLWYERATSLDLYEDLAFHILDGMLPSRDLGAITIFTKTLIDESNKVTKAGRNLAKTPLTAFVFGSSIDGSVRSMQEAFVQSVFDRIQAVATGADKQTSTAQIVEALNQLMGTKIPANTTIEQLMQREFSSQEKNAMMGKFYGEIGSRVEDTMKEYFGTFLERRNAVNSAVQGSFAIYSAIYQDMRNQEMTRLMDEGEIDFVMREGVRVPIHGMTVDQEQALRAKVEKVLPLANTAYTVDTDELNAGLYMAKSKQSASDAMQDQVKVQLGKRIPAKNGYPVSTMTGSAVVSQEASPGLAGLPYFMHSLDSFIMHLSLLGTQSLNVHDEAANGVSKVGETAQAINKATWQGMLKFSPASEAYAMLERSILNAAELIKSNELSPEAVGLIVSSLRAQLPYKIRNKVKTENLATVVLSLAHGSQWEANKVRLGALAQMTSIDQYTWEGGQYEVTDADRQEAADMLERLLQLNKPTAEAMAAADALDKVLNETKQTKPETPVKVEADRTSPFGELGKSSIQSDDDIVQFFTNNPKATAKDVIGLLSQPGRLNPINRKLLQLVHRVVSPALPIQYVTSRTLESDVLAKSEGPARGWYVVKGDAESIYVLSPAYKASGLTAETLLHELIHAAIAKTIAAPSKEAAALVAELEALRSKAAEYVIANKLVGFEAALQDVQEFVAWGMSNLQFQRDVLTKISFASKTKGNPLVTGMQKFIDAITGLLFKKPSEELNNGLSVLVSNVSGLFYEAGQNKAKPAEMNLSMAKIDAIEQLGTQGIFRALGNGAVSAPFQQHLAETLAGIEERLHGPFGSFLAQFRGTEAKNPLAAWLKSIETGKAPFASAIVASGMAGSAQEDFVMQQVEATVKAMLDGTEATTTAVYGALSKLYAEVQAKIKPQDFIKVGLTQEDYDFVFKLEADNGDKSDYLARFMALGLGHEKFNQLLKFQTVENKTAFGAGATMFDRMVNIFDKIVEFFAQKITHTFGGQAADTKLQALMDDLVTIEAKKRHSLARKAAGSTGFVATVEKRTKQAVDTVKTAVGDVANSEFIKKNKVQTVQAVGTAVRAFTGGRVDQVMDSMRNVYDSQSKKRDGIFAGLLREARGPLEQFKMLLIEAKKAEGERKDMISQFARNTMKSFKDGGKYLDKQSKGAISAVLLRTGAHYLMPHFSMAQIENMLTDRTALDAAIQSFEGQLTSNLREHHIQQANHLGMFRATGRNTAEVLMFNAHSIARMFGTQYVGQITEAQAASQQEAIAVLVSLYGIKYASESDLKAASEVMRTENLRNDGNGIEFTLQVYRELEKDSLQRLFGGNPTLTLHGYTPDITNPHTDLRVANRREGLTLLKQGYVKGTKVQPDPVDPDSAERHIYVLRDGGLAPWVSGFLSLTSMQARGSEKHNGFLNVNTMIGLDNAAMNAEILNKKIGVLKTPINPSRDLSKQLGGNKLAPTYNAQGGITNWRYLMMESTKNTMLERTNDFDQVIGAMAGSIFDKATSTDQNILGIKALREQYELDRKKSPGAYIEVGARSADREMRELWNLMPQATRDEAKAIWGRDAMMVRKDSLDITFGYRKLSAGNFLRKEEEALVGMQKVARELFNKIARSRGMDESHADAWAKRLGLAIVKGERGWQEIVHEIKDMVVVKNLTTLLGNIYANDSLLFTLGVKDRWHHQWVAMKGVLSYQADNERLQEIDTLLGSGSQYADRAALLREQVVLKDRIARNPVKPLIDAGMMPAIVEDVEAEVDPYSYKTLLARKVEGYTSRLPDGVKAVGRVAYMTHDTKLYKFLSKTTQYSDFVARYALYQHLTTKAEEPLSHADAISETSDAFVNYDVPTHRMLQYTDDMGITPFIKYFFRIQRVLLKTARENPARVLSLVLLGRFWDLGPIVLDSSFIAHIGNNPIKLGALRFFDTLDELLTVKALMALVK